MNHQLKWSSDEWLGEKPISSLSYYSISTIHYHLSSHLFSINVIKDSFNHLISMINDNIWWQFSSFFKTHMNKWGMIEKEFHNLQCEYVSLDNDDILMNTQTMSSFINSSRELNKSHQSNPWQTQHASSISSHYR